MSVKTETELTVHTCPSCYVLYAVPKVMTDRKERDGGEWFCPNGHTVVYKETVADKLRRERDLLKQQLAEKDDEIRAIRNQRNAETAKLANLQKRSAAGTCQCCHRTFSQLARHMKTKHPEFKAVKVVA